MQFNDPAEAGVGVDHIQSEGEAVAECFKRGYYTVDSILSFPHTLFKVDSIVHEVETDLYYVVGNDGCFHRIEDAEELFYSESKPSAKCQYCGCTNDHIYGTCDFCGAPLDS